MRCTETFPESGRNQALNKTKKTKKKNRRKREDKISQSELLEDYINIAGYRIMNWSFFSTRPYFFGKHW